MEGHKMTKVSLKVTKNLEEIPDEIQKHLSESIQRTEKITENLKALKCAVSLSLPVPKILDQVAHQHSSLESVMESLSDLYNICKSYAEILQEKESQEREAEVNELLNSKIAAFKLHAEQKIGQHMANEKLSNDISEQLRQKINELELAANLANKPQIKKKTTPRKK
jgi:ribosomal protein S13